MRRATAILGLLLALLLAACGGEEGRDAPARGDASASLWVTRGQGADVVLTATVPAGITVLEALKREADVETRYGGRFVQAINGIEGSATRQEDWFYFVNGIEPDVGSAEVTLHAGDVAWWDYRSWRTRMRQPVVVGAFPEPFRHGWDGERRPVEVSAPSGLAREAEALERVLGGGSGGGAANRFVLAVSPTSDGATLTGARGNANGAPVTFRLAGSLGAVRAAARALARDPSVVRYRYEARFDESGNVVP